MQDDIYVLIPAGGCGIELIFLAATLRNAELINVCSNLWVPPSRCASASWSSLASSVCELSLSNAMKVFWNTSPPFDCAFPASFGRPRKGTLVPEASSAHAQVVLSWSSWLHPDIHSNTLRAVSGRPVKRKEESQTRLAARPTGLDAPTKLRAFSRISVVSRPSFESCPHG